MVAVLQSLCRHDKTLTSPLAVRVVSEDASRSPVSAADPTGTQVIRARFRRDMDSRWATLRKLCLQALGGSDVLGLDPSVVSIQASLHGGDRVRTFQRWLDEAMRQVIMGYLGAWTSPYIDEAFRLAKARADRITGKVTDAGFDPGQERDPKGKWTETGAPGSEYFRKNWWKSGSVGGYNQPSPETVAKYEAAYLGKVEHITPSAMKKVGSQMGSNKGGIYQTAKGVKYYIKAPPSADHVKNELLAADLYNLAGAKTLDYVNAGPNHVATRLESLTKNNIAQFSKDEIRQAQNDFGVHAWLANWDAAGLGADNQGVLNGKTVTLDVGGSLRYRAQGGPKGAAFGNQVTEYNTLRDPQMNYDAAKLFGPMTKDQIKASVAKVAGVSDDSIRKAVKRRGEDPSVAEKLIARKYDLMAKVGMTADAYPMDTKEAAILSLAVIELQGICDAVSQNVARCMSEGLVAGRRPRRIATDVAGTLTSIGRARGRLLVNSIIVKAFSTATLESFREAGINKVGTVAEKITVAHGPHGLHQVRDAREALRGKVEVLTAGDEKVCRQCQDISEEGPYTLAEAHDLIPAHPNCRCAFIPAHDLRYASVHEDSATGAGAGILFMTPDGRGLFMRRCKGDHPGEWAFPAGGIEGNETAAHCAQREAAEETGHPGNHTMKEIDRRTVHGVDFSTFMVGVPDTFVPMMNEEHDDYQWLDLATPPEQLHPGVKETLAALRRRITADEFNPDQKRDLKGKWTSEGATAGIRHGYSKNAVFKGDTVYTDDVHDAVRALYEGKKVELDQPKRVSVLLEKLGKVTKKMIAMGEKAPNFNLCNVTVKGTSLFCADSKGIPRIKMPQMDVDTMKAFRKSLKDKGYTVTKDNEFASHLRATQNELIGAKVAKNAALIKEGKKEVPRITVSRDNYILDGHHKWAAMVGLDAADNKLDNYKKMRIARVNIDIIDLLRKAVEFTGGKGAKAGVTDYDPNQPRAPKGVSTGGQWVGPAGAEGDEPLPESENEGPPMLKLYPQQGGTAEKPFWSVPGESEKYESLAEAKIAQFKGQPSSNISLVAQHLSTPETNLVVGKYGSLTNAFEKISAGQQVKTSEGFIAPPVSNKDLLTGAKKMANNILGGAKPSEDLKGTDITALTAGMSNEEINAVATTHGSIEKAYQAMHKAMFPEGAATGPGFEPIKYGPNLWAVPGDPALHPSKEAAQAAAKTPTTAELTGEPATISFPPGTSKKNMIAKLLQQKQGTTTAEVLKHTGWPSVSMPAQAKAAGLKLEKKYVKGTYHYFGTPMTAAEKTAAKAAKAEPKANEIESHWLASGEAKLKATNTAAGLGTAEIGALEAKYGTIKKAAKALNVKLGITAAKPSGMTPGQAGIEAVKVEATAAGIKVPPSSSTKEAEAAAQKKFEANNPGGMILNTLASGKEKIKATVQTSGTAMTAHNLMTEAEKKAVQQQYGSIEAAHQKSKGYYENQLKQEKAHAEAKAKMEKEAAEAAEKNKHYMKELGINQAEAKGFGALAAMMGAKDKDLVKTFKKYEDEAKGLGLPITGFQAALIKNYSDGGYTEVNDALRAGSWTQGQHAYVKLVNSALQKMPKYEGELYRGTGLTDVQQAVYKEGNIVEERSLTSTSKTKGWSGNTQYTITAIGQRGSDITNLSYHPGEGEVLFSARTFFRVDKVEGKPGGNMRVWMTEMPKDLTDAAI